MSDALLRALDHLADADPDAVALRTSAGDLSRRALQRRSSAIARALVDHDVRPGDAVAVAIPRSIDSVAAILGVLRAGAAWVPIDPAHPADRRRFIADDAEVRATLSLGPAPDALDVTALPADAEPLRLAGTDRLNLLYTSGSTGRPKGVIGTHAAMLNRVAWAHAALPYAPGEVQAHRSALACRSPSSRPPSRPTSPGSWAPWPASASPG
jgi:non-ribosomal peptide synthetase component F